MHLRNKIGQLLIMGFTGGAITPDDPIISWLQGDGLGGVLLFDLDIQTKSYGKNLRDKEQIKQLTDQLNHYANVNCTLPLFIAVDYEGGAVDRLSKVPGCMKTKTASQQAGLIEQALCLEMRNMAITLKTLGFNLNFAPVIDLNLNEQQGIIGKLNRSFSANPQEVVRVASQFVQSFNEQGIICAYKHFPGHGSAVGDTHLGFVDVTDTFQACELDPYATLLADSPALAMIMTAHVINRQLDETGLPATLSRKIIQDLLREKLGYQGVIVSDDLQMRAVSDHYSLDEALQLTLNAGADMLIFGNQWGWITAPEVIDCIENLVLTGKVPIQRIEQAFERVERLKTIQFQEKKASST